MKISDEKLQDLGLNIDTHREWEKESEETNLPRLLSDNNLIKQMVEQEMESETNSRWGWRK